MTVVVAVVKAVAAVMVVVVAAVVVVTVAEAIEAVVRTFTVPWATGHGEGQNQVSFENCHLNEMQNM